MILLPFAYIIPLPKAPIHQFFQRPVLGRFRGVCLDEVVCLGLQFFIKAEDVIGGDEIDDPRGRHAVDLVLQDVPDARLAVRVCGLDGLAAVKALDDLRDV